MRKINFGFDSVAVRTALTGRCRDLLGIAGGAEVVTHLLCFVIFKRTGMCLFFGDAYFGECVENGLALNFQISRQIVNSNLTHPPFRIRLSR